jgi:O-antigen/teichoic acid export membrane protein
LSLRAHLVRGIFGSLGLTITSAGLAFVNGVLLARLLGASGYGVYAAAIAVVLLMSVPLTLGFDRLLVRDVAASGTTSTWEPAQGLVRRAVQIVLPVSLLAVLTVGLAAQVLGFVPAETLPVLWLALLMVPLLVLITLRRAVTQGLRYIVSSQLPDALVRPGVFTVLLLAAVAAGVALTALGAMALNVASVAVALIVGLFLLRREMPVAMRSAKPAYETRAWLRMALPFALATAATTLMNQIDVVLVGGIAGAAPAGLYAVATRGAGLAAFGAMAVSTTLAPTAAQLWKQHEPARLQLVVTRAARGAFAFALAVAVVLWIFGPQFLLLFGPEFSAANQTMALLALAQVIDCGFGIGGLLLSMTGYQSLNFAAIGTAVVVRIGLDIALIPTLGAAGAGVAAVVSITILNVIATYFALRRLRLDATPLGWTRGRAGR